MPTKLARILSKLLGTKTKIVGHGTILIFFLVGPMPSQPTNLFDILFLYGKLVPTILFNTIFVFFYWRRRHHSFITKILASNFVSKGIIHQIGD
jgi:hypothetical protein